MYNIRHVYSHVASTNTDAIDVYNVHALHHAITICSKTQLTISNKNYMYFIKKATNYFNDIRNINQAINHTHNTSHINETTNIIVIKNKSIISKH